MGWNTADLGFAAFDPSGEKIGGEPKEIDVDDWEFDHKCPKCGFSFNDPKEV